MGVKLPCGNKPLTLSECGGDCEERLDRLEEMTGDMAEKLNTIQQGAEVNVQSDWNDNDESSDAYIKNKPNVDYTLDLRNGLDALVDIVLSRGDNTESFVSIVGSGASDVTRNNDVIDVNTPVGTGAQLTSGSDTDDRAWSAKILHDWLEQRISQIPADQFLDLAKTEFVNDFEWSATAYPGSTNPNLDGKPVLVLALTDGTDTTYSFINMQELVPFELYATKCGDVVTIDDGQADSAVKALSVDLEPVQDLNGHDSVDVHRTGVNVWDEEIENGYIDLTTGENKASSGWRRSANYISCLPNTQYYLKCNASMGTLAMTFYTKDKTYTGTYFNKFALVNQKFTIPANAYYFRIYFDPAYYNNDISINYPSTDTEYHAYTGTTYTVPLSETVYGGTVDVTGGASKITLAKIVLDGTQPILQTNWRPTDSSVAWIYPYSIFQNEVFPFNVVPTGLISDKLPALNYNNLYDGAVGVGLYNSKNYGLFVRINDTTLTTTELINEYLSNNPITVVFPLATPTDLQTTPQEVTLVEGVNNMWSEQGDLCATYLLDKGDLSEFIKDMQDCCKEVKGAMLNNLKDGVMTGSLRGIHTVQEATGYPMGEDAVQLGTGTAALGKGAFAVGIGAIATKLGANAMGNSVHAEGTNSHAEGAGTFATKDQAHAEGASTHADGFQSHAEGGGTIASGSTSHAEGGSSVATAENSHAEGGGTHAEGAESHAEGARTHATAQSSHAEGEGTFAKGMYSHAEGNGVVADGSQSHAEGNGTTALSQSSHAEGNASRAEAENSHAEGSFTRASGKNSHAEGGGSSVAISYDQLGSDAEAIIPGAKSESAHVEGKETTTNQGTTAAHAEGYRTIAGIIGGGSESGDHAEGDSTYASGGASHAEGYKSHSSGNQSHAEGGMTESSGHASHAEGYETLASNHGAHAEGESTIASGVLSHAEGNKSESKGLISHVEGRYTYAGHRCEHVFGEYNVKDVPSSNSDSEVRGQYVEMVGVGTSDTDRKNGRTLDWNGNEKLMGSLTLGTGSADETTITAAQLKQLLALLN